MYCPQCGSEYRAGFYQCSDCNVSLVHEAPASAPRDLEASAEHVVVFESAIPGESEMVAGALEEAGISTSVRRSIAGGLHLGMLEGGLTPGQSYALLVPRVAEARAREFVSQLRPADWPEEAVPPGQQAPALPVGPPPRAKALARVVLAIILIPLGLGLLIVIVTVVGSLLAALFK